MDAKGLKLEARMFNLDGTQKFSKDTALDAAADSTAKVLELPQIDGLSPAYFLDLRIIDPSGKLVGSNFYWLSTKPETLDWAKSNWYTTCLLYTSPDSESLYFFNLTSYFCNLLTPRSTRSLRSLCLLYTSRCV